jgi:hypothetical protein
LVDYGGTIVSNDNVRFRLRSVLQISV